MKARRVVTAKTISAVELRASRRAYELRQAYDEQAIRRIRRRAAIAERAQAEMTALFAIPDGKRTARQNKRALDLQREYLKHRDAVFTLAVKPAIDGVAIRLATRLDISSCAATIIGIADNYGLALTDVIAEIERYIVQETKVADGPYTLTPRLARRQARPQ